MTDTLPGARAGAFALRVDATLDGLSACARAIMPPPAVRHTGPTHRTRRSDDEILAALRALAATLGRDYLTDADLAGRRGLSGTVLRRRFGSRRAAFRLAGVARALPPDRYTDLECFANMATLWRLRGGPPRALDADRPPSTVGFGAYRARSGTWQRAVRAYAAFTGADPTRPGPPGRIGVARDDGETPPSTPATQAGPQRRKSAGASTPLSLRFQVLQRDRFRCTACGNSPARDPDCALQVDHILPRSKGGRSTLENLRCLCAACNLGRGARDADGRDAARAGD